MYSFTGLCLNCLGKGYRPLRTLICYEVTNHLSSGRSQHRKYFWCTMHSSIQHSGSWQAKMDEIVKNEEESSETFKVDVKRESMQANAGRKAESFCWKQKRIKSKWRVDVRATKKKATVWNVWRKKGQKMFENKNQELVNETGEKHEVETSRKEQGCGDEWGGGDECSLEHIPPESRDFLSP